MIDNTNSEKTTDISMLKECTSGKTTLMIKTIRILINEIPKDIEAMKKALSDKDWEKLRSIAHKTKPNFMLVTKGKINATILKIEEGAREKNNLNTIPNHLKQLEYYIPSLIEELKTEIKILENDIK